MTQRWQDYPDSPEPTRRGTWVFITAVYLACLTVTLAAMNAAHVDWSVWLWAAERWLR
jgi:hypothetical protein